jgi:hypothetical protein
LCSFAGLLLNIINYTHTHTNFHKRSGSFVCPSHQNCAPCWWQHILSAVLSSSCAKKEFLTTCHYGCRGYASNTSYIWAVRWVEKSKKIRNKASDRHTPRQATSTRVRVTIVAVEKQQVLHNLSVCLQPYLPIIQCVCAVIYCHTCPVRLYNIFPYYLINGTIIGKKSLLNTRCVLTSLRYYHVYRSSYKVTVIVRF